jgi:2OG-Fe(II) oxygenase superfamily
VHASIEAFFFDPDTLNDIAQRHVDDYANAQPFPHVVLQDLVPRDVLKAVISEFPGLDSTPDLMVDRGFTAKKRSYRTPSTMGPHTRQLLSELNSAVFVDFLEELTGIKGLIPDHHFTGGGLHQIERGGLLAIHADFNRLDRLHLKRRMNLLVYLNEDWDESWGGQLELWSPDMTECVKRVAPTLGTCVIFNTLDKSFHGHPEPLECPPDRVRNSIALYYYTAHTEPVDTSEPNPTNWQIRPGKKDGVAWHRWVPPVAMERWHRLRRSRQAKSARRMADN